jgi:hypothetical protein
MRIFKIIVGVLLTCVFCARSHAGYTHYFTWHQKPNDADLKACISEMHRIIEARTNLLAGPDGTGNIIIDPLHVELNGIGDNAHEPFIFPGDLGFNFCKTEGKPYDVVVTACLLVAHDHFPSSLSINRDGSWPGDWRDGITLYSSVLGHPPHNPMSPVWRVVGWRDAIYGYLIMACLVFPAVFPIAFYLWKRFRKSSKSF